MTTLSVIRTELARYQPATSRSPERPPNEAAVALVLHEPPGGVPELLFIERSKREGDPWSGQMAFPGGRREPHDLDLQVTASRETLEEVGVELGEPIGQLDDFQGTRNPSVRPLVVAPYVYVAEQRPETRPNYEVADTVWVPLPWILDPRAAVEYRFEHQTFRDSFPAVQYERFTIWGLTHRVLSNFVEVLGQSLPEPGK